MSQQFRTLEVPKKSGAFTNIFWSGLAAGILDGLAGLIVYYLWFGFTPEKVFQFVASGFYGKSSFKGGATTAAVGFAVHFLLGFACAAIYFYAYPKIRALRTHKIASGLIYGLLVYLFMNLIVMPLSNVVEGPFDIGLTIIRIIWHMVCVGLPISLITSKYYVKN